MCRVRLLNLGLALLLLAGCASLKEKKASWFGGSGNSPKQNPNWFESSPSSTPPPPDPIDGPPTASRPATNALTSSRGVLAGRVIDSFNQQRPGTLIQVQELNADDPGEPTEVTANAEGYFMVQGLEPGRKYRLSARAKKGDAVLGGTTIASPPNVVLVIKVSEDLPAPEPAPRGTTKKKDKQQPPASRVQASQEQSWAPNAAPRYLHERDQGPTEGARLPAEQPRNSGGSEGPERSPTPRDHLPPIRPEYQTLGPGVAANNPPRAELPSGESARVGIPSSNVGVPSCSVSGNRLLDFALNDLNGQPFRFREQRGRLVLIDFWGTWCTPCMQSLPYLVDLQRRYGSQGLEVIGIAYEEGNSPDRVDRVRFVRTRQGLNYKVLVGEGDNCPVLTKLNVASFPTLLLVDETGEIVWRAEGLNGKSKAQLEAEIRRRLQ